HRREAKDESVCAQEAVRAGRWSRSRRRSLRQGIKDPGERATREAVHEQTAVIPSAYAKAWDSVLMSRALGQIPTADSADVLEPRDNAFRGDASRRGPARLLECGCLLPIQRD